MLSVNGLVGGYGKGQVLFDVTLELGRNQVVCLLGRNGMGKTTTIRTLMGLLPAWQGSVRLDGVEISGLSAARVARYGLGLVPEGRQIFPNLTVEENLLATAANRFKAPDCWNLGRVFELFPALRARRHAPGSLLSGGEQQMLAIGRALMTNPKVLLLDEATEGLAPVVRGQIWDCLTKLRSVGQSILIVDKHLTKLLKVADHFYVLEKGQVVWHGSAQDVTNSMDKISRYVAP